MGRIKELDYNTVTKIAAGEVIDRPASIVRELIDNSIDADSSTVSIHISDGGKTYIEVKDDGIGMDKSDIEICYKNHSTSKISSFDDITFVKTLGFRGEALSSIAEVAKTSVLSRKRDTISGYRLQVDFGKLISIEEKGINTGTSVIVKDLFAELPARKKFLSHASTETRYIDKEIVKKALAFHNIGFEFVSEGKTKYNSPAKNTRIERIADFFPDTLNYLLPLEYSAKGLKIFGFISKPEFIRPNRMYQFLFVNNRAVEWKNFYFAVSNAYGNLIPSGHFPAVFIYLEIEQELIDFNVHPMKREVRFSDEYGISKQIQSAIKEALFSSHGICESDETPVAFNQYEKNIVNAVGKYISRSKDNTDIYLKFSKDKSDIPPVIINKTELPKSATSPQIASDITEYRFLGIAFSTYIVMEGDGRIIFIDQHAVHERINYEKLTAKYRGENIGVEELLIPVNFDVPPEITETLEQNLNALSKMGFEMEHFGGNTFVIRSIPEYISYEDAADVVMGFVCAIAENPEGRHHSADFIDNAVKQMACKSSVRAGDKISENEVFALLEELMKTERPFSCPHGRPVMFSITKGDLEKQFKRTGF